MLLYLAISFLASIVGAICGVGGGVIIKPVLDLFRMESAATISFLASCTVLSMSLYSVSKAMLSHDRSVDTKRITPLAIGSVAGGLAGKQLFTAISNVCASPNTIGSIQSLFLAIITLGTLLYTVNKSKIRTLCITNHFGIILIGFLLGAMSSFLGIGGGPINLVVLYYFFSMDTKTAAANSLYIIAFSQISSLAAVLLSQSVPTFHWGVLTVMVVGGIGGGIIGRNLNKKISSSTVDKLFIVLITVIIAISFYNIWNYLS